MHIASTKYTVNSKHSRRTLFILYLPYLLAAVLLVAFVSLGLWQLDRAAYKKTLAASFDRESAYTNIYGDTPLKPFQPIRSRGRYLVDRQILIDNIVKEGRLGYYVVAPFEYASDQPLLLVNRGWLAKPPTAGELPPIGVAPEETTIHGKAGLLPRVGIRPGAAFEGAKSWPRIAVYPNAAEVAAELNREVLPFVLLLDPDEAAPMRREWQPAVSGPATHYGYALQWFAMAAAVLAIAAWNFRKQFLVTRD